MKYLTLFTPGINENGKSNYLYKDVKDVVKHPDGTITFLTQKGIKVESCLPWRTNEGTKEQLDALNAAGHNDEIPVTAGVRRQGRF